jgi:hypothetical protein
LSDKRLILGEDDKGLPALYLARAPGQVAEQPPPSGISLLRGAASGNPNADPRTGKFTRGSGSVKISGKGLVAKLREEARAWIEQLATQHAADQVKLTRSGNEINVTIIKGGTPVLAFTVPSVDSDESVVSDFIARIGTAPEIPRTSTPPGVDPEAWQRRVDAVRDAAREMDDMDEGDIRDFLKGRVQSVNDVDVQAFLRDVREQRLDDLADILDHQLRGRVQQMKRSRRMVRVIAPRGWVKRVFSGLDNIEVVKLMVRLEGKGWDANVLKEQILPRVNDEDRRAEIEKQYGERQSVQASDEWRGDRSFDFDDDNDDDADEGDD